MKFYNDNVKILKYSVLVIMMILFISLFGMGFSSRLDNSNDFDEIQDYILTTKSKDKKIRNKYHFRKYQKDVKGIDVSTWQGNIDWEQVKNSGIDFVMIRCGFRNLTDDAIIEDNKFEYNIKMANYYDIPVGVYFYSTAINRKEVIEEASFVLNLIKDYKITYPVAYDFELFDKNRTLGVHEEIINSNARSFMDYMNYHGYESMLYSNLTAIYKKWDMGLFSSDNVWLAQYIDINTYEGDYFMWQYSDKGIIPGIVGYVDLNEAYYAYEEIE